MKWLFLHTRKVLILVAVATFIAMFIALVSLSRLNQSYHSKNRELIIQNDSIIAVNINLTNKINIKDSSKANLAKGNKHGN
jgi:hypothetical protein